MIRTYLLPLLALAGLGVAAWAVHRGSRPVLAAAPVVAPAPPVFASAVAGSGMVEASSENLAIAAPVAGTAVEVAVAVGQRVAAGALLFRLDDRAAKARVASAAALVAVRRAALERQTALPRREDLSPAEALVAAARADAAAARDQLQRASAMAAANAIAAEEVARREQLAAAADARASEAQARLALLQAGAWAPDLDQARAELQAGEADADAARIDVERLSVTAPIAATVLAVAVHPGEFVPAAPQATPPVLLGVTEPLNVRVDVDENDAWRVAPSARAIGNPRGNPRAQVALTYVRTEPFVVPKRSLTGESTERVDTRVMQVIYRIEGDAHGLRVGQLIDATIEAPAPDATGP